MGQKGKTVTVMILPMTDAELAALEQKAKAATPGPWKYRQSGWDHPAESARILAPPDGPRIQYVNTGDDKNAEFIAATNPDTLLTLITAYRQQGEALRQVTEERDSLVRQVMGHEACITMYQHSWDTRLQAAEATLHSQAEELARLRHENTLLRMKVQGDFDEPGDHQPREEPTP